MATQLQSNLTNAVVSRFSALQAAGPESRFHLLGSVRQHATLSIALLLIFGVTGAAFAWIKGRPRYSATAVVFVSPRFVANLEANKEVELQSNSEYREYVQQNVRTINRYDIVEETLGRLGENRKLWMKNGETLTHATERLQHNLVIAPVPDTYQIVVSLESDRAEGLDQIVNTLVDTFLSKIKSEEFYESDQRIENLRGDRSKLAESIAAKQKRRAELADQLAVSTFTESFPNPYDRLVVDAQQALNDATRQRIQAEAQISALEAKSDSGAVTPLEASVLDSVNHDPALSSLEASINQRRGVLVSTMSGLAPEHPGRRAAERELKELESERENLYRKLLKSYTGTLWEQRYSDVVRARQAEERLRSEADKQASQATWFTERYQEALNLGLDIERERKRLDSIDDRIEFLSLESRAPGFVRLFSNARRPDEPVKGGRRKLALMAALFSILGAVLIPIGIDSFDPRIHWPGDVHRALGFPVLGWLLEKKDAGEDFGREQILRLAERLSHEHQLNGTKLFAFTAVQAGNGTTTIVRDVAGAMSRLGMPALAVEANAYRADAQYRNPKSRGLSVLLKGSSSLGLEVVPGGGEVCDSLPVGDVDHLGHLPDLHKLVSVLREAAELYPIVLVDLPPLAVSVDAEFVARSADLVVLIVEAEAVNKRRLLETARMLERVKPSAVAAVLNRVQLKPAGGFGLEAREEFYRGVPKEAKVWKSPWLWN
jgi:uncharacterized protein involved in exopolysaccharide biosynthesis/Mrp family chromosome partitioning ATPase